MIGQSSGLRFVEQRERPNEENEGRKARKMTGGISPAPALKLSEGGNDQSKGNAQWASPPASESIQR